MMIVVLSTTSRMIVADESDNAYVGIQYTVTSYNVDNFDEANPTLLIGRLGTFFNDYFALEGRLGLGLQDDTVNFSPTNVTVELDGLLGIYGLGHYNFNKTSSIYGLIGFTRVKATQSRPGFNSVSIYDSGLSLGVGVDIGVGKDIVLNVEYTQYLGKSNYDISAINLGTNFSV